MIFALQVIFARCKDRGNRGGENGGKRFEKQSKRVRKEYSFLCREMKSNRKEAVLVNQLLRSATSVGANLHEAQYAHSENDFIVKLEIAQKECYETEFWLELLYETDCFEEEKYIKLQNECGAIRRMLIASLKTVKSK